jgi:hypothetical protein
MKFLLLLPYDNSSDNQFRTWGQGISNAFASGGLVNTNAVGSINWATVLRPTGSSQVAGFEVWRFNDALQSTAPVYLKIIYSSATNSPGGPGIQIQVGTTTNGSGTFLGTQNTSLQNLAAVAANGTSGTLQTSFMSVDTNRVAGAFFLGTGFNSTEQYFGVERSKDNSGNDTTSSIIVNWGKAGSTWGQQCIPVSGGVPTAEVRWCALGPVGTTTANAGSFVVSPVFPLLGSVQNPGKNFMVLAVNDLPQWQIITLNPYGTPTDYVRLDDLGTTVMGLANSRVIMRFD